MPQKPVIRNVARAVIVHDASILVIEIDDGTDRWWILPGGKQEYGETAVEAVARECREELSCEVEVADCARREAACACPATFPDARLSGLECGWGRLACQQAR